MREMMEYYERRAPVYDETVFRDAAVEAAQLLACVGALPAARTLDVACGTGFMTAILPGEVVALDQSPSMLTRARRKAPRAALVRGDALRLPFRTEAFARVATSFFYGHLPAPHRQAFLDEARRVGREILVVDAAANGRGPLEEWEHRTLSDGGSYRIYSRRFTAKDLLDEIGTGEPIFQGRWFVAVWAKTA